MAVTMLAFYKRPDGGDQALDEFRRRYQHEHLPLMAKVPGLRETVVEEVVQHFYGEDIVLVTRMLFDDRATLDAAMGSDEMRAAGRNLREIAPGIVTLVITEEAPA